MNLAGNQAKQLFRSLRTGARPSVVGLWAAATAVDQVRKRSQGPKKELIASKKLKPGESYVIRMPGKDEGSLTDALSPGTRIAEIETVGDEGSIASQLFGAATELIGAATEEATEPEAAPSLSRRQRRQAAKAATEEPVAKLSRRQRRKATRHAAEEVAPASNGSITSTLVDVAASFTGSEAETVETPPEKVGRGRRRRAARLASLDEADFDRESLPRRRARKLERSERRARRRPGRGRVRKARRRQRSAAKASAKLDRPARPSRRKRRKIRAAERDLEYRRAKVEKRSTRRRRRKLRKAEAALEKLA